MLFEPSRAARNDVRTYTADQVDAIAAYCAELDRWYLIPIRFVDDQRNIHLRLAPARNNQRARVHWAHDFEMARLDFTTAFGAVAQLGERLAGSQKATGSSPVGSIQNPLWAEMPGP